MPPRRKRESLREAAPAPGDPLAALHPAAARWFRESLGAPTPPQALGWPAIARGENVLVLSPTGSGKTLAAFLVAVSDLLRAKADGARPAGVHTLYVSPLKALNADVHANLEAPLEGIRALDPALPEVTRALRTGDTPQGARQAMLRRPPDILVTTPESLYLLLTAEKARGILSDVRYVIVDEIHAVLGTKRGVHLALSLERLADLVGRPFQRIGLTATVRPAEEAAGFLGGTEAGRPRPVTIVDARAPKALDLAVEFPQGGDLPPEGSAWPAITTRIRELVDAHRSTLVFSNNRRLAERLARDLTERNPERPVPAHHGSVSKEKRKTLEAALKAGRLAGVVATSSLELGIDVGHVDLAVLVGSPRSVARGLQRVGRAGHQVGETSVGRFLPTHRQDLLETAVLLEGMREGAVEETRTPTDCLDVLAQQVVAHVASADGDVPVDELHRLVLGAWPYRGLPREKLVAVLEMLAGKYPAEAFRELRARLLWDRAKDALRPLPGSRHLAIRNGGAIPDRGLYAVYLEDGQTRLGELDEEFVFESRVGDVFALGANAWRILAIEQDRVVVTDAHGEMPKAPFWRGDQAPRPFATSLEVGAFLRGLETGLVRGDRGDAEERLRDAGLDGDAATVLLDHVDAQREATGALPTDRRVVVEHFRDELGDPRIVVHSIFGQAVNGALALGLRRALGDRLGIEVQAFSTDDGILLRFPDAEAPPPLDLLTAAPPAEIVEAVLRDVGETPVFAGLFRENAERALLLPRSVRGERRPLWLQRLRANDLLQVARRFEDFPLLVETYRDVLRHHLDVDALRRVLGGIETGAIEVAVRGTETPSPFASALLFGFLGIYVYEPAPPRAERTSGLLSVSRALLKDVLEPSEMRKLLRPEAIEAVAREVDGRAAPPRSADELALLLARVGDLSDEEARERAGDAADAHLAALAGQGRIVRLHLPGFHRWILAEEAPLYRAALARPLPRRDDEARRALVALREGAEPPPRVLPRLLEAGLAAEGAGGSIVALPAEETPASRAALATILARFARVRGPFEAAEPAGRYGLPEREVEAELDDLASRGDLARGAFTPGRVGDEWVDRAVLESVHRRTLVLLRAEAEPVDGAAYARFLLAWQHADRRHRRSGRRGLEAALAQLAGAAIPGEAWERDVLPLRVEHYAPLALAELSTGGEYVWVGAAGGRFRALRRGEAGAHLPPEPTPEAALSPAAGAVRAFLRENGASFLHEIDVPDLAPKDVAAGLGELVRAGDVTNDSFDVMRHVLRSAAALVPRAPRGRGRFMGRWALVHTRGILGPPREPEAAVEAIARGLLARYGVASREVAAVDGSPAPWTSLAAVLARLEARGEIRRGYFVRGLSGHQYALPEAVERLREARRAPAEPEVAVLTVADPANPWGSQLPFPPGAPFRRVPSSYVVLLDGAPVALAANAGRDLWPLRDLDEAERGLLALALHRLLDVPAAVRTRRSVVVGTYGGKPVLGSEMHKPLEDAGFENERGKLVLYPSHVRAD